MQVWTHRGDNRASQRPSLWKLLQLTFAHDIYAYVLQGQIHEFIFFVQVEGIKEISDMVTKLKRAGDGLGTHIIDKEMA